MSDNKPHQLPELPYELDALEPHISKETLSFHYGKHHATYVKKLNEAIKDTQFADMSLEEIVMSADGGIFNNAAQAMNHAFYWKCLTPKPGDAARSKIARIIERDFGGLQEFKKQFTEEATGHFGSGWAWLVTNQDGSLEVMSTHDADTPLRHGQVPLLTCDVWEHAYYIDYRNARPDYLEAFWNVVDWDFMNEQYIASQNEWPIQKGLAMAAG